MFDEQTCRARGLRCACSDHALFGCRELAPGLQAGTCVDCGGDLLALDEYRTWRDTAPAAPPPDPDTPLVMFETLSARSCPACERLMQRLRSGIEPDFRIDRCTACQLVWLDSGEWEAIERAGLRHRLVELLSDGWQRQVQAGELSAAREQALRRRYGDACVDELVRIRAWLAAQPQRDELLGLIGADW